MPDTAAKDIYERDLAANHPRAERFKVKVPTDIRGMGNAVYPVKWENLPAKVKAAYRRKVKR